MTPPSSGPLSLSDLQAIWESSVDETFSQSLEQNGANGGGFEAYQQAWAQLARVSQAIDTSTQAMFILPWSGQTAPPAAGARKATVTLTLTRSKMLDQPLVLSAGTLVGETITDWGTNGGVTVQTGRRYALDETIVFPPGQQGPLTVTATAERPGYGYNNPAIGTLTTVEQVGTGFANIDATVRGVIYPGNFLPTIPGVTPDPSIVQGVYVDAIDRADAFLPDHVGQYIAFTAGANSGKIARIVGWSPPNLSASPPTGGTIQIERTESTVSFVGHSSGTFRVGELLFAGDAGTLLYTGVGTLLDATPTPDGRLLLTFAKRNGAAVLSANSFIFGTVSHALAAPDSIAVSYEFTPEVAAASWRILDWVADWGMTATNTAQPTNGLAGVLDEIGRERNLPRAPGETDDAYRQRLAVIADVVTPNAIRRALNRTIPGMPWCLREVGQAGWPGFFYDLDAWDYDAIKPTIGGVPGTGFLDGELVTQLRSDGAIAHGRAQVQYPPAVAVPGPPPNTPQLRSVAAIWGAFEIGQPIVGQRSGATFTPTLLAGGLRPEDRFRLWVDYLRMRAFFWVTVPRLGGGDSGFAYDDHPFGGYDGIGFLDFYDGAPWGAALTYRQVEQAIDRIRAGGVGFELIQSDGGPCP